MKILRFLLFPFAILYDGITSIRNLMYDVGFFKSTSFDIPVIAVGNLSTGGTGKSPQIEYLIRLLQNDYKVAVLSRGYKRKTKGFLMIKDTHTATDVGDEPLQFYTKFKNITVAVDANRTHGIQELIDKVNPEVILLDDAYQHRKVKAGYYVLLTKYNDLYTDDFLLPTGNLREHSRGRKRASVIVVTKCPEHLSEAEMNRIKKRLKPNPGQLVFFTKIGYNQKVKGGKEIAIKDVKNTQLLLVTGIANASPLLEFLNEKELKYTHLNYPDHHNFSSTDIAKINSAYEAISSKDKLMVTTEKDFMRLQQKINNLYYLGIQTEFLEEENKFKEQIMSYLNS